MAPEHVDSAVLKLMRKPPLQDLEKFECIFMEASREAGLEQYLVPYFIAGFPGCTPGAADAAGVWLRKRGQRLRQVQTFIPLPGTMAAALYACGTLGDGTPIFVADLKERRRQKRILTGGGKKFH